MTSASRNCPNCGAAIQFQWAQSVQTVCEYCRSIIVRHDVDLALVGQVSAVTSDSSPIQLGTEGIYQNRAFAVAGRIAYEYEDGSWNEWHLMFQDGTSGWLSDAQIEYSISFLVPLSEPPSLTGSGSSRTAQTPAGRVDVGARLIHGGTEYQVTTLTRARYAGVDGELPFEYWDKLEVLFADLRTHDGRFGTIDYSEDPPLLFLGEAVELETLRLKNLREFEGWEPPR